jgi:hypothetical protein
MDEIERRKVESLMQQEDLQRAKEEALQKKRDVCSPSHSLTLFSLPSPPSRSYLPQSAAALAAEQKALQEQNMQKIKEEQIQNKAIAEEIKVSRQNAVEAKQKLKTQNRKYVGRERGRERERD